MMLRKVKQIRCAALHGKPMWPIHGQYECRVCGRKYPVPWCPPHTGKESYPGDLLPRVAIDAGR